MSSTSSIDTLGVDELSQILSYLTWKELLKARVCKQWREAVKLTLVPPSMSRKIHWIPLDDYCVFNREYALQLPWLVDALPRLQTIFSSFHTKGCTTFLVEKGENPIEGYRQYGENSERPPIDFRPISKLKDLRSLTLEGLAFSGSYDYFFNSFPNLEILDVTHTGHLRWDLSMVANMPRLKELHALRNNQLTGNLDDLRVLESTLEILILSQSEKIEGSIMSLAKFPKLRKLTLSRTKITGDIRDIGEDDFVALTFVGFPDTVYGGEEIRRIEDAPEIMQAWYRLKKRNPGLSGYTGWVLADNSPQRYEWDYGPSRAPPVYIEFVKAGPRLGWRWTNHSAYGACETNWLDPEPDPSDPQYEEYLKKMESLAKNVHIFCGFHSPPNQLQHEELNDTIPPPLIPLNQATNEGFWHFVLPHLEQFD